MTKARPASALKRKVARGGYTHYKKGKLVRLHFLPPWEKDSTRFTLGDMGVVVSPLLGDEARWITVEFFRSGVLETVPREWLRLVRNEKV